MHISILGRRLSVVVLASLAMCVVGTPGQAAAQEPPPPDSTAIALDGNELREALFIALDAPRLEDEETGCEPITFEAVLLERYSRAVELSPQQVADELKALSTAYAASRGADACARRSLDEGILDLLRFAQQSGALSAGTKAAFSRVSRVAITPSSRYGNGMAQRGLTALDDRTGAIAAGPLEPVALLERAVAEAAMDAQYAQARDHLSQAATGHSILATTAQLRAAPEFAGTVVPGLVQDGQVSTTYGELMGLAAAEFAAIAAQRDSAAADLAGLDDGSVTPATSRSNHTPREETVKKKRRGIAVLALISKVFAKKLLSGANPMAVLSKALNGTSRLLNVVSKVAAKVADLISTTAANGVQLAADGVQTIGRAFFSAAEFTASVCDQLRHMVTSFLAHNQEGLASDHRVLSALDALRNDIAELRTEMNARFDRIDARLDEIYATMVSRFDEVLAKLENVEAGLSQLRDGIVQLSAQIARLERNVFQAFKDSENRDLWEKINTAIGYRERSVGGAAMSNAQFLEYEGFFFTWATQSAYDTIAVGPVSRAYDEASVEAELQSVPLEGNLPYLSSLGVTRFGLAPLSTGPLPNVRDLAVSARAYAALLAENPEYVTEGIKTRLDALLDRAQQVSTALAKVAARDVPGTATGSSAFNAALDFYRNAGTGPKAGEKHSLTSALEAVEAAYAASLTSAKGNALGLDPWGSATQTPPPLDTDTPFTNGVCPNMATPSNVGRADAFPPALQNGMRLGVAEGRVVCTATATNQRSEPRMATPWTDHYADITVQFVTERKQTGGGPFELFSPLQRKSRTYANVMWCTTQNETCSALNPMAEAAERWEFSFNNPNPWRSQFESSATTTTSPLAQTRLVDDVESALRNLQKGGYQHILGKLGTEPLLTPLRRLNGAKGVLEAYAEFGLWRSLHTDGEMRGLLYGDQPLPHQGADVEHQWVGAHYAAAAANPPATNARVSLGQQIMLKAAALQARLTEIIAASNPATARRRAAGEPGTELRSYPLIETTIARLALTRALPTPDDGGGGNPGTGGSPGGGGTTDPVVPLTPGQTVTPVQTVGPGGPGVSDPKPLISGLKITAPKLRKLSQGLGVSFVMSRAGRADVKLSVSKSVARKLRLGKSSALATLSKRFAAAGPASLKLKVSAKLLRRLTSTRKIDALVVLTFTAADGAKQTVQTKLTLKR